MRAFVEVVDLWSPAQIGKYLIPLHTAVPTLKLTAYAIPNKLGPVRDLKHSFPWITFAMHGFERTPIEAQMWTREEAHFFLERALEMEYEPIFLPPSLTANADVEETCRSLGITMRLHQTAPDPVPGISYYRGSRGGSFAHLNLHGLLLRTALAGFIGDHPGFQPEELATIETFLSMQDVAEIAEEPRGLIQFPGGKA